MAVDTDYLDDLLNSIGPVVYPEGDPAEAKSDSSEEKEEVFGEDEEFADSYEKELADILEKVSADTPEKESGADIMPGEDSLEQTREGQVKGISGDIAESAVSQNESIEEGIYEIGASIDGETGNVPTEIELDLSMSEEEIEAMLNAAREVPDEKTVVGDDTEMTDILAMFGDDENISDIKDTLEKADNNIAVDQSMLEMPEVSAPNFDEEEESSGEEKTEESKKKKEKKNKKNKNKAEKAEEDGKQKKSGEGKKQGFFARLLSALTEEDEEEIVVPEQSETGITSENAKILSEIDSEENEKGKKKKKKGKKDKKDKKGGNEKAETEGDEKDIRNKPEDGDSEGDSGKEKKKKPKKDKKDKAEKAQDANAKPEKKLPKKRVRNTFILCLSILAAIVILSIFLTDFLNKKQARFAFDNQDYETAYSDLYGMELEGEDKAIYDKSMTIMLLTRKADSYENYTQLGMKKEALNALLEGVGEYQEVLPIAQELGVENQVNAEYGRILEGLKSFGLSEADAKSLVENPSKVEYNEAVRALAEGRAYNTDSDDTVSEQPEESDVMDDILPEELDMLPEDPSVIMN